MWIFVHGGTSCRQALPIDEVAADKQVEGQKMINGEMKTMMK